MFRFTRYIKPSWQFNIEPVAEKFAACFYTGNEDDVAGAAKVYTSVAAQQADIAYYNVHRGLLTEATKEQLHKNENKIPLKDEYIFMRRYGGTAWTGFTFMLRMFTLKNPFKEIAAFLSTRHTKRISPAKDAVTYPAYDSFHSALVAAAPTVAVIIPTLNRYSYLKDVLTDLEKQTYSNIEVIVVDQSDPYDTAFYKQFHLNIKLIRQQEKLLWTARNNAVKSTDAEYLLFFDDDSRVEPDWVEQHMHCLDFFNADISAGVSLAAVGQKISDSYYYFRWADQFDSGNALVKREVFKKIGLFDEQFNGQRMGDGEFGYRAYKYGMRSISNYKAPRVHLKVPSGGLREMGSWDGFRPMHWFAPKPVPSVVYLYKKYFPKPLYRNAIFIGIMLSNVPYKYKGNNKMLLLSIVLTVIKSPLLLIQYLRARSIAGKMLQSGYTPEMLQ